jgi:hypothetical protein
MHHLEVETAINALNGEVQRDLDHPDKPIIRILLWNAPIDDEWTKCLRSISTVRSLGLRFTRVSDKTLEYLSTWEALENLDCGRTLVRGDGLAFLACHCPLATLSLAGEALRMQIWFRYCIWRVSSHCGCQRPGLQTRRWLRWGEWQHCESLI